MSWTAKAIVEKILSDVVGDPAMAQGRIGHAFAPANIALIKYWGKRNALLNLPINSSFSVSLGHKGAKAFIELSEVPEFSINGEAISLSSLLPFSWAKKIFEYLDLFSPGVCAYHLRLELNIPVAAGLASSACIFAAVVKALDNLYQWQLSAHLLSILARLGSGSAARSIEPGFVEWHRGQREDGMDSYGERMDVTRYDWPEWCVGLCILETEPKKVSSREGMQRTVATSSLYAAWPDYAENALSALKSAIRERDFNKVGAIVEHNALSMHATMQSAWPPLIYSTEKTWSVIRRVARLRQEGCSVYFTQDAGPNVKLLFLARDRDEIEREMQSECTEMQVVLPFSEIQK